MLTKFSWIIKLAFGSFLLLFVVDISAFNSLLFDINSDDYLKLKEGKETFDSTFNSAWKYYMNNWDSENLNPYEYNYNSFNQPVNLCLSPDSFGFCMPVTTLVTSEYGHRHGRAHQGVDLDLETGDTVVSAFDGIVRMSKYYYGYGNMVVVRHNNGLETLYGHLSKNLVKVGDVVKAGQVLGLGGNTGHSFGSHLHFEMRFMGTPINPAKFISFEKFSIMNNEVVIDSTLFTNNSNKLVKKPKNAKITDSDHSESHYKKVKKAKAFHTIKSGDTLGAIARKHKTTVSKLCKLNKIKSTATLKIGRKLIVK